MLTDFRMGRGRHSCSDRGKDGPQDPEQQFRLVAISGTAVDSDCLNEGELDSERPLEHADNFGATDGSVLAAI